MRGYKEQFDGKKITLLGLGSTRRLLDVARFLLQNGAELIITDERDDKDLPFDLAELGEYKEYIEYVLGRNRLGDFEGRDVVIRDAEIPADSPYIERAQESGTPVETETTLFLKLLEELVDEEEDKVATIGVTGTSGKSTVAYLLYHILNEAQSEGVLQDGQKVHVGGLNGQSVLPLVHRVQPGDVVVMELGVRELEAFGDARLSPHIAVLTNIIPDHMEYFSNIKEYFKTISNIFKYQKEGDYLIVSEQALEAVRKYYKRDIKGTLAFARTQRVPASWKTALIGEHNKENIALCVQTAELLDIRPEFMRRALEEFKPLSGRLEYIKTVKGVKVYNDTHAVTPEATIASLKALSAQEGEIGNILLITGGEDKNLDYGRLAQVIDETCKAVITLQGSATGKLRGHLKMPHSEVDNLKTAVHQAMLLADKGDVLFFSPASRAPETFKNAEERGERFVEAVRAL